LIELPFLQFSFRFDAVDFLFIRHTRKRERDDTICFICSGVMPGDVGWGII